MYSKLSTRAIVLRTDDVGEKDVLLSLFTREFGFMHARASSVRSLTSRLRFALQPMTICFVSVVHGKAGWRLTNATFLNSLYFESSTLEQQEVISKILTLISRLYIGEEPHTYLFDMVEEYTRIIQVESSLDDIRILETFIVFKLLEKLGYIESQGVTQPLIAEDSYTPEIRSYITEQRKFLMPYINSAIRNSGL